MLKKGRRVVPQTQEERWEREARRQIIFAKNRKKTLESYGEVMERSSSRVWELVEGGHKGCGIISGYTPNITDLENRGRHLRLKGFFGEFGCTEIMGGFGKVIENGEIEDVLERALVVWSAID